jgi:nucleoside-diphosphate-sugar epimerase
VSQQIMVAGPGWLGGAAAERWAQQGHQVWTLRRSAGPAPAGCTGLVGNLAEASPSADWPVRIDHLVVAVPPSSSTESGQPYAAAAAGAAQLADTLGARSLTWISSTGVYDRQDGRVVDESTPIDAAASQRVRTLWEAEQALIAHDSARLGVTILRASGLYGPGRDPARRYTPALPDPDRWTNFAWRDDVVAAIEQVGFAAPAGSRRCFNCSDGHSMRAGDIVRALHGVWPEPSAANATSAPNAPASSGPPRISNQRVSATALRAEGWNPSMPTVLHGLVALGHTLHHEAEQ